MAVPKSRYWSFVGYPESWPNYYADLLGLHVPFIGALHDSDVDVDGEVKKEHFHVILEFEAPTTCPNVLSLLDGLPIAGGHVERVASFVGSCRYLLHLDDPDKFQYSQADALFAGCGGWFDFERPKSAEDRRRIRDEILCYVVGQGVYEYADLVEVAHSSYPEWVDDVDGSTVFWTRYLASKRGRDGVAYNSESR